jgi:RNA polymerase sigma-70 factor (ECF subfamily)
MPDLPPPLDADSFEAHARFVRSLAGELARDPDEADEVVARTFAAAIEQRPRTGTTLGGWFARVARRVVSRLRRDEVRRAARERAAARDERVESLAADPATIAARAELIERVATAFASLDEPYRTTLYHRFYDEWSVSRIAAHEGIPSDTVKTRVRRGLQRLREQLDAAHQGRRDEWRGLAILVATRGGAIVAVSKVKVAAVAAVLAAIAAVSTWQAVARANRERGAAETATARELEGARSPGAATSNGDDAPAAAPATAHRAEESIPFASGVVVDPSGAPIAGVLVVPSLVVQQFDGQWLATPLDMTSAEHDALATTAAGGRFRIAGAPRNIAGLYFFKHGLVVGEWFELSARHEENADHRVVLGPAARVHGRVVDTSTRPIAWASVGVHPQHPEGKALVAAAAEGAPAFLRSMPWSGRSTATSEDGRFEIDSVNEVPCWCWVSAAGYGSFPVQRELVERDTEFEIVLRRETAVLVDVRDAKTKEPVANARALSFDVLGTRAEELHLPYEEWLGRAWDGTRMSPPGRLTIWCERLTHDLNRPGESRALRVVVFAEGYRPAEFTILLKHGEEPPHEMVELSPREPVAMLAGAVTGAQEASIELRFDPTWISRGRDTQNSPVLATRRVGLDGGFAFHDLPPATYRLSATSPGRAPIWFDVTTPRDDVAIRFALAASLVARVVDSKGAAVAGEVVQLQSIDEQRAWCATTGPDGNARFEGLPTGGFDVVAHMPFRGESANAPPRTTSASNYLREERVTLVEGENGPIELRSLERRPVTLHFEFADGSVVADAQLFRLTADGGLVDWTYHESERLWALELRTDADGFVDVDLHPGSYELFVVDQDVRSRAQFVVPRRGEDAIEVKLAASRRFGVVRGRLVSTPGDHPIAGWKVGASVRSTDWRTSVSTAEVITDDDGRFRIDRCPIGSLLVGARDPSTDDHERLFPNVISNAKVRLDLEKDATADVTIRVPRAEDVVALSNTTLELDVTSADDGRPIPRVQVLVEGTLGDVEFGLVRRSLPCDEAGHLSLRLLGCDRYHVSLYPPELRPEDPKRWKRREVDVVPLDGVARVNVGLERYDEH